MHSVLALLAFAFLAQRGSAPQAPPTPRSTAPIDMTGYWVSIVAEDWRWRMITPPKGDFSGVPLNADGQKIMNAWDPAKDEAAKEECKSYGAANIMRVPERLRITWQDENTLKVETDAGTQTRLFHFSATQDPGGTWQGVSKAEWEFVAPGGYNAGGGGGRGGAPRTGSLKVVTNRMKPGYLRKNGVPYSANATVTEYYDVVKHPTNGQIYLVLTQTVDDPTYLTQPMLTSAHFRKQADASGWNPTPCTAR
jgi:hypothetical protein